MGDVVNTDSRLQTQALAGHVVVGEETFLATANVLRYESRGLLHSRGREEPLRAFVAHEALTAPGRSPCRLESPLIGRDAEVELLCSAFRTGINYRRPHLALLVGEAGMGKSRLAEHVVETSAKNERALVLVGRSRPHGEANVWWPIADALRGFCRIGPTEEAGEARARCLQSVAAVRSLLEELAAQHPTLLVISDVQWADQALPMTIASVPGNQMGWSPGLMP